MKFGDFIRAIRTSYKKDKSNPTFVRELISQTSGNKVTNLEDNNIKQWLNGNNRSFRQFYLSGGDYKNDYFIKTLRNETSETWSTIRNNLCKNSDVICIKKEETNPDKFWDAVNKEYRIIVGIDDLPEPEHEKIIESDEHFQALIEYHTDVKFAPERMIIKEDALNNNTQRLITKIEIDGKPVNFIDYLSDTLGNRIMLVSGAGGTGKTFLILEAVTLLRESEKRQHFLYVALNDINFKKNQTIEDYINSEIFKKLPNWREKYKPTGDVEIIFLLDGFNEIPRQNRAEYAEEIVEFLKNFNSRIVITSRYEDVLEDSDKFKHIIRADMCRLDKEVIDNYLSEMTSYISNDLFKLFENPLILTLYGQTSKYNKKGKILAFLKTRKDSLALKKQLCNWIPNEKVISDSAVIYNYLCCEVLKIDNIFNADLILKNYLAIRFIWAQVAYYMQEKNTFVIYGHEFLTAVDFSIKWIQKNYKTNAELIRISREACNFRCFPNDFEKFILSLESSEICTYLESVHTFFNGRGTSEDKKYKFFHQSMRDLLAAVHLLNIAPTNGSLFSEEEKEQNKWETTNFSENIYMLRHISKLIKAFDIEEILEDIRKSLEGQAILKENNTLKNLLLIYNQENLLNDNFTKFKFSGLDLRYCDLTDYKVSDNDKKIGADFEFSTIGEETFKLPAHSRKITSIAVSSDGRKVLSCGKDKVLLWNFGDRTIDKELYHYSDSFGERNSSNNQVSFSADDKYAIYSDGAHLIEHNLENGEFVKYLASAGDIVRILTTKDSENINCYIAMDNKDNILRWRQGNINNNIDEKFIGNSKIHILAPTYNPSKFLARDENNKIIIVDDSLELICEYGITYTGGTIAVSPDGKYFALATMKNHCVEGFNVTNIENCIIQSIKISYQQQLKDIAISFDPNGNYLLIMAKCAENVVAFVYQKEGEQYAQTPFTIGESIDSSSMIDTSVLHGNYIYYVEKSINIKINAVIKDDKSYYNLTYLNNHLPIVKGISFSQIDGRLYAAYEDGDIREWDYYNGTLIQPSYKKRRSASATSVINAHSDHLIASGDMEGYIMLWDSDERRFIRDVGSVLSFTDPSWDRYAIGVSVVAFTYDDEYIIAISGNGTISIWSILGAEKPLFSIEHDCYINSVLYYNFKEDQRVILGGRNGNLFSYRMDFKQTKFEPLYEINEAHANERILSLALSPQGNKFISYGEDGYIREWDALMTNKDEVLLKEIEIESESFTNASSCQYSHDGSKIYLTVTKNKNIQIAELSFDTPNERNVLYEMENYSSRNEGIIKRKEKQIISGDHCGKIYFYDILNENTKKVMTVNSMSREKIKYCIGFEKAMYDPEHLREVYVNSHIVDGKLKRWLQQGIIPNIVALGDSLTFDNEIAGDISDLSAVKKFSLFSDLVISSTIGNENTSQTGESALLEANLIYLYFEAPPDEQNMMMICELIRAGYNHNGNETDLARLFNMLREKNQSQHIALEIWDSYIAEFGDNNKDICKSLLKRLDSLNVNYIKDGETETDFLFHAPDEGLILPKFTEERIRTMASSLACNSDTGKTSCPAYFTDVDEAQILFLQLIFYNLNMFSDEQRTPEKAKQIFGSTVKGLLNTLKEVSTTEVKKLIKELQKYEEVYSDIEKKNQFILSFWREFN